jgi:hypothetical protein
VKTFVEPTVVLVSTRVDDSVMDLLDSENLNYSKFEARGKPILSLSTLQSNSRDIIVFSQSLLS